MTVCELPLVPATRLASVLSSHRRVEGLDLATVARRSDGRFTPTFLERIERGLVDLDDALLRPLIEAYRFEDQPVLPDRSELVLDLDAQRIGVGDTSLSFENPAVDAVLERYVALVYLLRDEKPGRVLPLRGNDLDVLGYALDRSVSQLRRDLEAIMVSPHTDARTRRLASKLMVAAAGLLVGCTAVGSLVIIGSDDDVAPIDAAAQTTVVDPSPWNVGFPSNGSAGLELGTQVSTLVASPVTAAPATASTVLAPSPAVLSPRSDPADLAGDSTLREPAAIDRAAVEARLQADVAGLVPGWTIDFLGERAGYQGMTFRSTQRIEIYVDPDASIDAVAHVLAHEIGHAIDLDRLDDTRRQQWLELRSMPLVWWAPEGEADFEIGAGDFAEAVAFMLIEGERQIDGSSGRYTAAQLDFVRAVLD